LAEFLQRRPL
jgi:hypothetical protein